MLFADLVGSTALASGEDPERVRLRLEQFYEAMTAEIESAGGTVEKFAGDAVMAVFGVPAALEDHAERALHARSAMQRRLHELFGDELVAPDRRQHRRGDRRAAARGLVVRHRGRGQRRRAARAGGGAGRDARRRADGGGGARRVRVLRAADGRGEGQGGRRRVQAPRPRALADAAARGRRLQRSPSSAATRSLASCRRHTRRSCREERPVSSRSSATPASARRASCASSGGGWPSKTRSRSSARGAASRTGSRPTGRSARCCKEQLGVREDEPAASIRDRLGDREVLGLALGIDVAHDLHPLVARDRFQDAWVELLSELDGGATGGRPDRGPALGRGAAARARRAPARPRARPAARPRHRAAGVPRRPIRASVGRGANAQPRAADRSRQPGARRAAARHEPARRRCGSVLAHGEGNPVLPRGGAGLADRRGPADARRRTWTMRELPEGFVLPDTVQAVVAARIDLLDAGGEGGAPGRLRDRAHVLERAGLRALPRRPPRSPAARAARLRPAELRLVDGGRARVRLQARRDARGRLREHPEGAPGAPPCRIRRVGRAACRRREDEYAAILAHHYAQAVRPEDADLAWVGEDERLLELREKAIEWLRRAARARARPLRDRRGTGPPDGALALDAAATRPERDLARDRSGPRAQVRRRAVRGGDADGDRALRRSGGDRRHVPRPRARDAAAGRHVASDTRPGADRRVDRARARARCPPTGRPARRC